MFILLLFRNGRSITRKASGVFAVYSVTIGKTVQILRVDNWSSAFYNTSSMFLERGFLLRLPVFVIIVVSCRI